MGYGVGGEGVVCTAMVGWMYIGPQHLEFSGILEILDLDLKFSTAAST